MTASPPVAFDDPQYREAVVDLLAAIAYGEISAFERLAEDAKLAPTLEDKVAIASMATAEFAHVARINERLVELGADPFESMAPFREPIEVGEVTVFAAEVVPPPQVARGDGVIPAGDSELVLRSQRPSVCSPPPVPAGAPPRPAR